MSVTFHCVALTLAVSEDLHRVLACQRRFCRYQVTLWRDNTRLDGACLVHGPEKPPQQYSTFTVQVDDVVQPIRHDHLSERVDAQADRFQDESFGPGRRPELIQKNAFVGEVFDGSVGRVENDDFVLVVDGDLPARPARSSCVAAVVVVTDGEPVNGKRKG